MFQQKSRETPAVSGVATIDITDWQEGRSQVTIHDVTTGVGTMTLTAMPSGTDEFQAVTDGTADLSDSDAVLTFTINGNLDQIKATSSDSGDVFKMIVGV